ncbi:MarR family winged helix-turn-helix transcriptional regulator [Micromonospora sp. NPDC050417]|uniref:MarR family winged helix-turn-helix transcriptional regulator n=1 Tax=Micromonospora sp. NPDC050417 TaxID=3364280 RepID=UPI0037900F78
MSHDAATTPNAPGSPDRGEQVAADLLKDDFGWALGVILRRYSKAVEELLDDVPGGARGYQVVASASQNLAMNQGALGAQLGIDRTVLTYLIDDLEAAGLVSRQPDPSDRRSRRVVATEAGQTLWQDRRNALTTAETEILSVLGNEQPAFKELLQRVATHADRLDPLHNACQVVEELTEPRGGRRRRRTA